MPFVAKFLFFQYLLWYWGVEAPELGGQEGKNAFHTEAMRIKITCYIGANQRKCTSTAKTYTSKYELIFSGNQYCPSLSQKIVTSGFNLIFLLTNYRMALFVQSTSSEIHCPCPPLCLLDPAPLLMRISKFWTLCHSSVVRFIRVI